MSQCYHSMCKMLLNHVYMNVCIDGCVYLPLRCSYSTLAVSLYAFLFVSVSLNRLLKNTRTHKRHGLINVWCFIGILAVQQSTAHFRCVYFKVSRIDYTIQSKVNVKCIFIYVKYMFIVTMNVAFYLTILFFFFVF